MNLWRDSRAVRFSTYFVLFAAILIVGGQLWLTSGIGKGMVETRLSSAMGRPVRLEGDFSIQFFPVPGAAGSNLKIYSKDGQMVLLDAGKYRAQLVFGRLLRGEVEVVALRVEDAALDTNALANEEAAADDDTSDAYSGVPAIENFQLTNARVYFDGMGSEPHVQIVEMELDNFRLDSDTGFYAVARLILADGEAADFSVRGRLSLESTGVLEVELAGLNIEYQDWLIEDIRGGLLVGLTSTELELELEWTDDQQQLNIRSQVDWNPTYPEGQGGVEIRNLEVLLDAHFISGRGCFLQTETPQLHLELVAPMMKLGDIRLITEKWSTGADSPAASAGSPDELPIDLAVSMVIDQASYEDMLAEGVRITAGAEPDCPETL